MSKENLDNYVPLDKTLNGMYATEYDKDYLEDLGLLKMDFLGLRNLTVISKILSDIKDLTFDTIPEGDKDALNIFIMLTQLVFSSLNLQVWFSF